MNKFLCPVCSYKELEFQPYSDFSNPATGYLEYCPSCGFQFGVHDLAKGDWTWSQWRYKWVSNGMIWDNEYFAKPKAWNPKEQLKSIGIDIDKPGWEDLEPQFDSEGKFIGVKKISKTKTSKDK